MKPLDRKLANILKRFSPSSDFNAEKTDAQDLHLTTSKLSDR